MTDTAPQDALLDRIVVDAATKICGSGIAPAEAGHAMVAAGLEMLAGSLSAAELLVHLGLLADVIRDRLADTRGELH